MSVEQHRKENVTAEFPAPIDESPRATKIPDEARRIIASMPSVCIASALMIGGFFGWLTSKR